MLTLVLHFDLNITTKTVLCNVVHHSFVINVTSLIALKAFDIFEQEFAISPLLSPDDMAGSNMPDSLTLVTYLAYVHNALKSEPLPKGL